MSNDQTSAAPLPQPPRPEVDLPSTEAPRSPQEAVQAQQERPRITLTVARDLSSRGASLNKRFVALVTALNEVGIDGTDAPGLRGQLNDAYNQLRSGAELVSEGIRQINDVKATLEDL